MIMKITCEPMYRAISPSALRNWNELYNKLLNQEIEKHKFSPEQVHQLTNILVAHRNFQELADIAYQRDQNNVLRLPALLTSATCAPKELVNVITAYAVTFDAGVSIEEWPETLKAVSLYMSANRCLSRSLISRCEGIECINFSCRSLNLSHNLLTRIPVSMIPETLRSLALDGNHGVAFEYHQGDRPLHLEELSLRNTNLREIPLTLAVVFPGLRGLYLDNNPCIKSPLDINVEATMQTLIDAFPHLEKLTPEGLLSESQLKILKNREIARIGRERQIGRGRMHRYPNPQEWAAFDKEENV